MNQEMFPTTLFGQPATMNGKKAIQRPAKSVKTIPSPEIGEKLPSDSTVVKPGDACVSAPEPKLDQEDEAYLKTRERVIRAAIKSSIAAARALHEIHAYKDGLLWKKDHPSFEAYCRVRWNYGKSHAYRLRDCGGVVGEIESAGGSPLPLSEGQIRPLLQLPPENRVECWEEITAGHKPEALTARMISDDVGKFAASRNIDIDRHRQQPEPSQRATKILDQLRKVAADMERGADIGKLIDRIHSLMIG